jgi:hypothetical protein
MGGMECVYIYIHIYIMYFQTLALYGDVGVIRVCVVGANGRTCVFLG